MIRGSSKKIKKNRRLKDPFPRRVRRFIARRYKLFLAGVLIPACITAGVYAYREIVTTPKLAIKSFNVSGLYRISKEEVLKLSGLKEGQNILSFKKLSIINRIRENPWIEEVRISRRIPDTLDIEVKERTPVALIRLDDMYVMDSSGVIFKKLVGEDDVDLPIVTGLTVEKLGQDTGRMELTILELINVLSHRNGFNIGNVSEIHIDPTFGFSVYTVDSGIKLYLGNGNFEEKFSTYDRIVKLREGVLTGIESFDLSDFREVVVSFTNNVVQEGGVHNG